MDPDEEEEDSAWGAMDTDVTTGFVENQKQRVILHFDLDCFYAQVEMIRNPALRSKPLGVQQKYIIVTSNYVARELGVTKLMLVKDALEKCPQLVLVNGEDLTHYRETSYRVTDLLMSYTPLVERLGFDENFVDVTEMVESRMKHINTSDLSFVGHVYGHDAWDVPVQDHVTLAVGSVIAAELRGALHSRLGLTSCAGVAHSKLLAKLVSGTFKPNQQSALLPHSVPDLMGSLSGPCRVPGIGYRTGQKLKELGVVSVRDLQLHPLPALIREFGEAGAKRIQSLACGVDPSPVTPAGPPQSLSDEDSFRKISNLSEVESKITELLSSLTERMYKDGRLPHTLRLTLRRSTAVNHRWFSRESRQCPIPHSTASRIIQGRGEAVPQLVSIAIKLFHKLVKVSEPFHLTLLNVCFTNLQPRNQGRNHISSFFTQKPTAAGQEGSSGLSVHSVLSTSSQSGAVCGEQNNQKNEEPSSSSSFFTKKSQTKPSEKLVPEPSDPSGTSGEPACSRLPPHIDPEVFRSLPEHIQTELMSSFQTGDAAAPSDTGPANTEGTGASAAAEGPDVPPDVDPTVFSQLPPEVQRELRTEWRQSKPALKISSRNTTKRTSAQVRRGVSRPSPNSGLLRYFKPG
ncbi:DNA polymerase iota [Trichomycterus rosablanca]|uniref:DNA polymerase iota n=1 Tax=Trichomycterus rosablanca TaxID=2290929 RepID=UPI002F351EF7